MSTLLIDLEGHELKQEEVELLEHPLVAGLILFTRNFYDRQQVQALIKSIRQRVKKPYWSQSIKKVVACNVSVKVSLSSLRCRLCGIS